MPIFDFTCRTCNKDFELLVRTTVEKENPTCPNCGTKLIKLFSPVVPNFRMKGDGWTGSKIIPIIKEK